MSVQVRVRRLHEHVALPQYQTGGAAGFDLAASSDLVVPPRSIALVPTGLVIEVPEGHFLGIFARSSTPLKRGLIVANGVGVIDSDYCGETDEIKIQVLNVTDSAVDVKTGDRLAQGLLIPIARADWSESAIALRDGARGGFGATGER